MTDASGGFITQLCLQCISHFLGEPACNEEALLLAGSWDELGLRLLLFGEAHEHRAVPGLSKIEIDRIHQKLDLTGHIHEALVAAGFLDEIAVLAEHVEDLFGFLPVARQRHLLVGFFSLFDSKHRRGRQLCLAFRILRPDARDA